MAWLRLGELLMGQNFCSREALIEAWDQKTLFGDRLGTNLLAIGAIGEEQLARTLGQQHQTSAAFGNMIEVQRDAVALLPKAIADLGNCVPHHVQGNDLYLLMMDPTHRQTLDAVRREIRQRVVPVVVCEARMWDLLATHYGISRNMRPIDLHTPPKPKWTQQAEQARDAMQTDSGEPVSELTSEAEFHAMYARVGTSSNSGVPGMESMPQGDPVDDGDEIPIAAGQVVEDHVTTDGFVPASSVATIEHEPTSPRPSFNAMDVPHTNLAEEGPLAFADAIEALRTARSRTELAENVLRYALNDFKRVALFTVHPAGIAGWKAFGDEDFTTANLSEFQLARAERSVFSLVIESRSHYIGPLETWKAHGTWIKATGRKIPKTVAVFPVLLRGNVINLLYGDNGHDTDVDADDVGNLLILMQAIASSYEELMRSRSL